MEPICSAGIQEAVSLLPQTSPFLIFCEESLPDGTYKDLLREIGKATKARLVVMSPNAEQDENYNEAIALGAFDMIASPSRRSDVQWIAIRAMHEDARRTASKRRPRLTPHKEEVTPATPEQAPRVSKGTASG